MHETTQQLRLYLRDSDRSMNGYRSRQWARMRATISRILMRTMVGKFPIPLLALHFAALTVAMT